MNALLFLVACGWMPWPNPFWTRHHEANPASGTHRVRFWKASLQKCNVTQKPLCTLQAGRDIYCSRAHLRYWIPRLSRPSRIPAHMRVKLPGNGSYGTSVVSPAVYREAARARRPMDGRAAESEPGLGRCWSRCGDLSGRLVSPEPLGALAPTDWFFAAFLCSLESGSASGPLGARSFHHWQLTLLAVRRSFCRLRRLTTWTACATPATVLPSCFTFGLHGVSCSPPG